jgi:hypothetical protein
MISHKGRRKRKKTRKCHKRHEESEVNQITNRDFEYFAIFVMEVNTWTVKFLKDVSTERPAPSGVVVAAAFQHAYEGFERLLRCVYRPSRPARRKIAKHDH